MKLRSCETTRKDKTYRWRSTVVLGLVVLGAIGLAARAVELQLVDHGFLAKQGDQRSMRVVKIAAHRGAITDRNGEPLAISTPVDSVWVNPQELALASDQIPRLAQALKLERQELAQRVTSNEDRQFLYLVRHLPPAEAQKVRNLGIPGVYLKREYRRYYPSGEVAGQILGFTNVDDAGQEGLELAFDHWLAGTDGAKRVIQDGFQRVVQNVDSIREASPGHDLTLSIDLRIQYLAYRELKAAVRERDIILSRVPGISSALAEQIAVVVRSLRSLDLKKAPSVAETLDWARTLVVLGRKEIGDEDAAATLHILLKYQTDIERATKELLGRSKPVA